MSQDAVHTTARLYLCTDARQDRGDFADFVDAAFAGGVDIIQLRDKSLEAAEELELLEVLHQAAHRHGRLWAVNDRADLASLSGAPVFHIGQKDIPTGAARKFLGKDAIIGLSTHSPEQVDAAIASSAGRNGLDYFCVGPVWATPTKPGRAAVGLELVRYAAEPPAAPKARGRARCRGSRSAASISKMWNRWWTPAPAGSWWSVPSPRPTIPPAPPGPCSPHSTPPATELAAQPARLNRPDRAPSSGANGWLPVPP